MFKKYRKKPVVIEAIQIDHNNIHYLPGELSGVDIRMIGDEDEGVFCLIIETLEGRMTALEGDWIIRGVEGELYPCKARIFDATYEAVDNV